MAQHRTQVQSRCDGCAETAYLVGTPYGLWCGRCWRLWIRAEPQSRTFPVEFGRQARETALAQQAVLARRAADQLAAARARQVALEDQLAEARARQVALDRAPTPERRRRARVRPSSSVLVVEEPEPEPEPKSRRLE